MLGVIGWDADSPITDRMADLEDVANDRTVLDVSVEAVSSDWDDMVPTIDEALSTPLDSGELDVTSDDVRCDTDGRAVIMASVVERDAASSEKRLWTPEVKVAALIWTLEVSGRLDSVVWTIWLPRIDVDGAESDTDSCTDEGNVRVPVEETGLIVRLLTESVTGLERLPVLSGRRIELKIDEA